MNDIVKVLIGFTAGGVLGVVIGNKLASNELNDHMDEVEADHERIRQQLQEERKKRRELVKQLEDDADTRLKSQGVEVKTTVEEDTEYPPEVISENQFRKDIPYVDYSVLTYFRKDGVLIDESEERVFCPVDKIGEGALDLLRTERTQPIYVHNPNENMNYEIVINESDTYAEYMGEYDEED